MSNKKIKFSIKQIIENVEYDRKKAIELLDISKTMATTSEPEDYSKILIGQSKIVENLQKSNQQLLELILAEMKKKDTTIDPTEFSSDEIDKAIGNENVVEMD